ncbi:MAG: GH3, partial [uncultured Gemmatimonadetes bacterium]
EVHRGSAGGGARGLGFRPDAGGFAAGADDLGGEGGADDPAHPGGRGGQGRARARQRAPGFGEAARGAGGPARGVAAQRGGRVADAGGLARTDRRDPGRGREPHAAADPRAVRHRLRARGQLHARRHDLPPQPGDGGHLRPRAGPARRRGHGRRGHRLRPSLELRARAGRGAPAALGALLRDVRRGPAGGVAAGARDGDGDAARRPRGRHAEALPGLRRAAHRPRPHPRRPHAAGRPRARPPALRRRGAGRGARGDGQLGGDRRRAAARQPLLADGRAARRAGLRRSGGDRLGGRHLPPHASPGGGHAQGRRAHGGGGGDRHEHDPARLRLRGPPAGAGARGHHPGEPRGRVGAPHPRAQGRAGAVRFTPSRSRPARALRHGRGGGRGEAGGARVHHPAPERRRAAAEKGRARPGDRPRRQLAHRPQRRLDAQLAGHRRVALPAGFAHAAAGHAAPRQRRALRRWLALHGPHRHRRRRPRRRRRGRGGGRHRRRRVRRVGGRHRRPHPSRAAASPGGGDPGHRHPRRPGAGGGPPAHHQPRGGPRVRRGDGVLAGDARRRRHRRRPVRRPQPGRQAPLHLPAPPQSPAHVRPRAHGNAGPGDGPPRHGLQPPVGVRPRPQLHHLRLLRPARLRRGRPRRFPDGGGHRHQHRGPRRPGDGTPLHAPALRLRHPARPPPARLPQGGPAARRLAHRHLSPLHRRPALHRPRRPPYPGARRLRRDGGGPQSHLPRPGPGRGRRSEV